MRHDKTCPELKLSLQERRKRAKHFAVMTVGANALTRRQIRRLPSGGSPSAERKQRWMMLRIMRRSGLTMAELS